MPSGWSIYGLADPTDGIIRYVGKANSPRERLRQHLKESRRPRQGHLGDWLRQLLRDGLRPIVTILETGVGEGWQGAERRWIASFPPSQLTNHLAGGDGMDLSGPNGEATREKIRQSRIKNWRDPSYREKMDAALSDPTYRANLSKLCTQQWKDPVVREKMVRRLKDPDFRKSLAAASAARWENPIYREKMTKGRVDGLRAKRKDPEFLERMKAIRSKASSEVGNRPEARARMSKVSLKNWQDPSFRERMKQNGKSQWEDPAFRAKMLPVLAENRRKFAEKKRDPGGRKGQAGTTT